MSAFGLNTSSQVCWPLIKKKKNFFYPLSISVLIRKFPNQLPSHLSPLIPISFKSELCLPHYQFEIFTSYLLKFIWQWRHVYVLTKKSKQLIYREYLNVLPPFYGSQCIVYVNADALRCRAARAGAWCVLRTLRPAHTWRKWRAPLPYSSRAALVAYWNVAGTRSANSLG